MTGLGRRTREEILEKWDQTDSPEIPDKGETSESSASLRRYRRRNGWDYRRVVAQLFREDPKIGRDCAMEFEESEGSEFHGLMGEKKEGRS